MPAITQITTSLPNAEIHQIDALLPEETRAATVRLMLRYALHNKSDVLAYLNAQVIHNDLNRP